MSLSVIRCNSNQLHYIEYVEEVREDKVREVTPAFSYLFRNVANITELSEHPVCLLKVVPTVDGGRGGTGTIYLGPGGPEGIPGADCVGLSFSVVSYIILVVIWRVDALAASGHLAYGALFVSLNFLTAARNRCRRPCVWCFCRQLPYKNVFLVSFSAPSKCFCSSAFIEYECLIQYIPRRLL